MNKRYKPRRLEDGDPAGEYPSLDCHVLEIALAIRDGVLQISIIVAKPTT